MYTNNTILNEKHVMCNTITAMRIHILDTTTKEIAEHGKQIEAQTPFILPPQI